MNPVEEGYNFALAKRGLPLFFVHIAKKERKSTYPNEEQTRHWRLPREGATPVRKKCKITYEENNLFPAVPPQSCAVGAVCSLGGTGIPPRCDGERHLSRGDAPSFSTFRLIFTDTRHKRGESCHKRGKCRHKRADFRRLCAEQRRMVPRRCTVESTDCAAFHRHAPRHARNPHRRRRAL